MTTAAQQPDLTVLDNLAWHALNGPHETFARVNGAARRYDPEVAFFSAIERWDDEQGWADLAELVGPGEVVNMSGVGLRPGPGWESLGSGAGPQYLAVHVDEQPYEEAVVLTAADAEQMTHLTGLAEPGPWFPRTYELGTYVGVKVEGELVAMAGERLHAVGYTEISAVCTHPDHQGRGYAGRLVRHVSHVIRQRGEQPLLHVRHDNWNAIRLYEKLGFELRATTTWAGFRAPR